MADQWRSTDQEWHPWWDAAWQPTPRWLSAHDADREAQFFDWPTAAQQCWSQSPSAAGDATVPMNTDAPSQDPHSSLQDAFTQTRSSAQDASTQFRPVNAERWDALPDSAPHALRVLLRCKCNMTGCRSTWFLLAPRRLSPYAYHRHTTPGLPPLLRQHQHVLLPAGRLWCNKPAPPMQERLLYHIPMVLSYRMSVRPMQEPSHVPLLSSACEQLVSTVHAGTLAALLPSGHQQQYASTSHAGEQAQVRNADRTGHEPFSKPAAIVLPMSSLAQPQPRWTSSACRLAQRSHAQPVPALRAPVESWPSSHERHGDHPSSLWSIPRSDSPRSRRSSRTTSTPSRTVTTSPICSMRTRSSLVQRSSPSLKPPQAQTRGNLLLSSCVVRFVALSLSTHPQSRFCSVHLHNKVAKKRDALTTLLQRLREHMINHSVDFIGGDFNKSAFSTVGGEFSNKEFAARRHPHTSRV